MTYKQLNKHFKMAQVENIINNNDFIIILSHTPKTTKEITAIRNNLKKTGFNMVITKKNLLTH